MTARVLLADEALGRLAELDLTIERVLRRADAEASFCTALDPPIMEGLTRWARTNRYLLGLAGGLASSPGSPGDRGIVVEVSRL